MPEPPPLPSKRRIRFLLGYAHVTYALCPGFYELDFARKIEAKLKYYDDADLPPIQLAEKAIRVLEENNNDNSDESGWARGILHLLLYQARMKVSEAALSLEIYRTKHGTWPNKLSDLEGETPIDPLTGKELMYTHTDSGCMVYSVGENQKDNGGKTYRDDKDDIIFRLFNPERRNKPLTPL